ncbi:MAG: DUF58 domain-containing protein, partial [Verrucomicrobiales bacterium]
EWELPAIGSVRFHDPESGEQVDVDTSRSGMREAYAGLVRKYHSEIDDLFRRLSVDCIDLRTDRDYLPALHTFFKNRERAHA